MTTEYVDEVFERLHAMPEVAFQEHETSRFILKELRKFGYIAAIVAKTGIIATLNSEKPGPVFGVRADMDALPFVVDGEDIAIHACGHDANSSMVLAMAKDIAEKGISRGKLILVFQPAEEVLTGARAVLESGKLDELGELIGIHLRPEEEAVLGIATPALRHGSSYKIKVKIDGKSAHGARPHQGVNSIDAAVLAVNAVNAVRVDPRVSHSAKVTVINSLGDAFNTIPETTNMVFDLRAQTNGAMDDLRKRVTGVINDSVELIGASAEIKEDGIPAADYDDEMIDLAKEAIEKVLGRSLPPIETPGGEDFHFYTENLPALRTAYIGLGADLNPGLHKPDMEFDQRALRHGRDILKYIVTNKLG